MHHTKRAKRLRNFIHTTFRLLLFALLLSAGCESDDDNGDGGHDFGDLDPSRCAVVGDSIAAGYGSAGAPWPARLAGKLDRSVANYSTRGRRMGEAPAVVNSALSSKIGYIIISLGANDAINGSDPAAVKGALGAMLDRIQDAQAIPIVGNVTQMAESHALYDGNVDQINRAISEVCGDKGVTLVNLHGAVSTSMLQADGLHANSEGQEAIAKAFASKLHGRIQ